MLHQARVIVPLAILALGGCGQHDGAMVDAGTDSAAAPRAASRLMPTPADLASAVGANVAPRLLIYKYGLAIAAGCDCKRVAW